MAQWVGIILTFLVGASGLTLAILTRRDGQRSRAELEAKAVSAHLQIFARDGRGIALGPQPASTALCVVNTGPADAQDVTLEWVDQRKSYGLLRPGTGATRFGFVDGHVDDEHAVTVKALFTDGCGPHTLQVTLTALTP
jgi:hypothetical protein